MPVGQLSGKSLSYESKEKTPSIEKIFFFFDKSGASRLPQYIDQCFSTRVPRNPCVPWTSLNGSLQFFGHLKIVSNTEEFTILLEKVGVPYNTSDLRRSVREGWGSLQCI
ncbi:hypothetical protein FKM82_003265 [Ascaphus truei]